MLHTEVVPPAAPEPQAHGNNGGGGGKLNKLVTPTFEMGMGPDKFGFWKEKWTVYKRSDKLTKLEDIRDQLISCCSEELYEQ